MGGGARSSRAPGRDRARRAAGRRSRPGADTPRAVAPRTDTPRAVARTTRTNARNRAALDSPEPPKGPGRRALRILWWISPVLVALAAIVGSAEVTAAQPEPTPTTVPTTAAPPPPARSPAQPNDPFDPDALDDADMSRLEREVMEQLLSNAPAQNPCAPTDGSPAQGDASSIVPDDCWGRFPSSHYDIGCDEGAWNHIGRKVYCTFTDLSFQGARSTTATALWMVEWAYGFGVYERFGGPAITIAETYETQFIGPLGLSHLAWFYAISWAGFAMLRGRVALAGSELAMSFLLAALAAILLANPSGYLQGAFDTMGTVSGALLSTGTGQPPPDDAVDADAVLAPLQAQLHRAFVEDPYDHLNWGGSDMPAQCVAMRDRILAFGPHGNNDGPRDAMESAGCQEQADFNHDPNGQRLFGAVLTLSAALVMVVLVGMVSLTIVVAQIVAVVLFAVAPFAALGAILPGGGRVLALGWLSTLIRVALVVVGMSFVLSLLLLTIRALLTAGDDADLVERFALVNIVVLAMFAARRRVLHAGASMAAGISGSLAPAKDGGDWLAAGAVGGVTGFALAGDANRTRGYVTSTVTGNRARRRAHMTTLAAEQRGLRPVARESTEYSVDDQGRRSERRSVSIAGVQPVSRRARAARTKLERQAGARADRALGVARESPLSRLRLRRNRGGGGDGGDSPPAEG